MGLTPENTLVSFRHAIDLGCEILELDVHLSRDRELVVIHDETVDRTTDGHGAVTAMTAAELKRLDAGSRFSPEFAGERIPLLGEVLDLLKDLPTALNIEIKNGPVFHEGIELKVAEAVTEARMADRVVVSSFDHAVLPLVKEALPEARVAPLVVSRLHEPLAYLRRLGADGFHPRWNMVTPELVEELHAHGLFVNTWIVNDRAGFERMTAWGLDAVGTNDPGRIRASSL